MDDAELENWLQQARSAQPLTSALTESFDAQVWRRIRARRPGPYLDGFVVALLRPGAMAASLLVAVAIGLGVGGRASPRPAAAQETWLEPFSSRAPWLPSTRSLPGR